MSSENKGIEKKLTGVVEKLSMTLVGYNAHLKSLDNLRNVACSSIAKLSTLREIENLAVGEVIDNLTASLKVEGEEVVPTFEKIIDRLYDFVKTASEKSKE